MSEIKLPGFSLEQGPNTPERAEGPAPEAVERSVEPRVEQVEAQPVDVSQKIAAAEQAAASAPVQKDEVHERIERWLAAGLADEYKALTPEKKTLFKKGGESVASFIRGAVSRHSIKTHELLKRVEKWLLTIADRERNPWWLKQEALIKSKGIMDDHFSQH